jgi:tRNA-intron endonuclease
MPATFDGDVVRADERARERFYDSRGYGRPVDGRLHLEPVEAAHLLFRGDLESVSRAGPDGAAEELGFRDLLAIGAVRSIDFLVYKDLRDRGFYLTPNGAGFTVYPRGDGPWDDAVAYQVRPTSERGDVAGDALRSLAAADATGVLAVVDEESELTYLSVDRPSMAGSTFHQLPATVAGDLLADRVLVADPPPALHGRSLYGQPLGDSHLQLSLVEAAHLAGSGALSLDDDRETLVERGRAVEGDRFDRRLRVYGALRTAGIVPKTGFKFGADFRTYADVQSVDDLGHAENLVRVHPADHTFAPRDLSLDVRLAHGVRKRMVYALTGETVDWLAVARVTP